MRKILILRRADDFLERERVVVFDRDGDARREYYVGAISRERVGALVADARRWGLESASTARINGRLWYIVGRGAFTLQLALAWIGGTQK